MNKELLNLVLDEKDDTIGRMVDIESSGNILFIRRELGEITKEKRLNLDTLARLCKEWCLKQGYEVYSALEEEDHIIRSVARLFYKDSDSEFQEDFYSITELEAIIKATEYIAKEKGLIK